ncbi:major facilitator superfamily domain-containing protein [Hyaloraphidium curvatum]|nr:major facilitator superfamily domain-containing protein [Hyaloraphidium curvatum]
MDPKPEANASPVSLAKARDALAALATDPVRRPENPWKLLSEPTKQQWLAFVAAFLGWTLDATDYFLLTLAVPDIAKDFGLPTSTVTSAITLTLLLRPLGALIFGLAGDRWGRRYPLMVNVVLYSALELATGFCPDFASFLAVRALFGVAMGGEWGLGASLAMEALPVDCRGLFAGFLQQGYAAGNLLASGIFAASYAIWPNNWRALFYIGSFPAVLVLFIRFAVPESKAFENQKARRERTSSKFFADIKLTMRSYWARAIYCTILMACFNFLSHGSQDLYPTYITEQLGFDSGTKAATIAIQSTGAIIGGTIIGYFGQYLGRRRAMIAACVAVGALVYPWAFSSTVSGVQASAFFMQFFVQGAWGAVPSYLAEISPPAVRATFPGLMYNLGNMISSASAQIEATIADRYPTTNYQGTLSVNPFPPSLIPVSQTGLPVPNYALTQAIFVGSTAAALVLTVSIGAEKRDADLQAGGLGTLVREKGGTMPADDGGKANVVAVADAEGVDAEVAVAQTEQQASDDAEAQQETQMKAEWSGTL